MSVLLTSKKKRSIATAALLLTVALVSACGGDDPSATPGEPGGEPAPEVQQDDEFFAMLPPGIQESGTISVGTEALYPPYEYLDEDGTTVIGLDPELLDAVTARLGIEYELTDTAFDGLLPALEGKRFDVVAAAVTDNTERQEKYDFVDYFNAGQAIVVAAGNPEGITTVEDLCGKAVSVLVSSAQEALLNGFNAEECASDQIDITALPNDQDALLQVQSGRAVATFTQEPVGRYNAAQIAGGSAFEVSNSEPLFPQPLGYVFPKDSTELRDAFQAAVQSLIDDGTYGEILDARDLGSGALDTATVNGGTQ